MNNKLKHDSFYPEVTTGLVTMISGRSDKVNDNYKWLQRKSAVHTQSVAMECGIVYHIKYIV